MLCYWCGKRPAAEGDTLCNDCWGAKSAGLTREEFAETDYEFTDEDEDEDE